MPRTRFVGLCVVYVSSVVCLSVNMAVTMDVSVVSLTESSSVHSPCVCVAVM